MANTFGLTTAVTSTADCGHDLSQHGTDEGAEAAGRRATAVSTSMVDCGYNRSQHDSDEGAEAAGRRAFAGGRTQG
jgi:hypothetical protein